ncbi:MAG: Fe2+ transport system protein FeoA [Bacteriovoracaceae bacterium]|jgi:Fe2+ transport system protein FeoA
MTLNEAVKNKWYTINSISEESEELQSRFIKLGFIPGAKVLLKRAAPIFQDPLLFQLEDSQIALTRAEAKVIEIKEIG